MLVACLCSLALFAGVPARAGAQGGSIVYKDPSTGFLVYVADLSGRSPGEVRIGYTGQIIWFFNPFSPLEPRFGCQFIVPAFPHAALCQPPANGLTVQLGPGRNDIRILGTVPALPGPNLIQGNKNVDAINGGQSNEQIKGGKGFDKLDPGPGEDDVDAGAGNDSVMSRDGATDKINCGPGRRDLVKPDRADRLKRCEIVK